MAKLVSRVRKRDGSEESFDGPRLADSLRAAVAEEIDQEGWAEELVETVRVQIGPREESVPTAELARHVIRVLRACGLKSAARNFRTYRRALEEAVARLRVHTRKGRDSRSRPWDRHRLALSLVRDRYLEMSTARRVSALVERRLVMADLGHVTGRLVAAIADNECRSLGLRSDPLATEHVGVDRRELRAWLGGDCLPSILGHPRLGPEGQDPRPALGEELLARFALEEVLSAPQAEGLALGLFQLPALGDWMRPARLWLCPGPAESESAYWDRVRIAKTQASELQLHLPLQFECSALSHEGPVWLADSSTRLRLSTSNHELALVWADAGHWVSIPAAAFAQTPADRQEKLGLSDRVMVSWQPPRRLPSAAERMTQQIDGSAVINLAHAALEAGPWQPVVFQSQVAEALELSCRALLALSERAHGSEHPRISLLPCGLEPAMRSLFPDEKLSGDRIRRQVLSLRGLFEKHARSIGMRLDHVSPPHPGSAGMRLAELDGLPPASTYTCGWTLSTEGGVPDGASFDTAPWLQFPGLAALQNRSWLNRLPRQTDAAES
jgi:ATP cone domain-containing protein